MNEPVNPYEQERRTKRDKLRELGVDPYGQRTEGVRPLAELKSLYKPEMGHDGGPVVRAAGRIVLKRDMGKLSFLTLRDDTGDLQVGLDKRRLDDTGWNIRSLLDLGDLIVVEGPLGVTNKGEVTVWGTSVQMSAKALLPPPAKWEGLEDVETRYRQRYVDLFANPEVMRLMKLRGRIMDEVRNFMRSRGFEEVETPMMQLLHGGAAARPFMTHHNALDIDLYLRIAPELYLKRLLVGGYSKVFELNRNFRNEGISPRHNPEFTMLEAYEAYGSWQTMAELVESMTCHLAQVLFGSLVIEHKDAEGNVRRRVDLAGDETKPPGHRWPRVRMVDLVTEFTEKLGARWEFDKRPVQEAAPGFLDLFVELRMKGQPILIYDAPNEHPDVAGRVLEPSIRSGELRRDETLLDHIAKLSPAEQLVEVYEKLVEPTLIDPVFVTHVPSVIIPLAKENRDDPYFADVYELAINGTELSPGYTELNDPEVQAKHFLHQVGDEAERQKVDDDFLTALKYGMPPAGGMGLGIDRLVMLLTGAESIRDVILFPLMRPREGDAR